MALSRTQVNRWANACLAVGNEVVGSDGFVPVRGLLSRFDAQLELRPLLVEAMLCESTDARDPAAQAARWRLLVDSEKYPVTTAEIHSESAARPLPARFRNTVAHELTHSLAFRAKEFGVDLTIPTQRDQGASRRIVDEIEQHTEDLSPLLLAPDVSVDRCFPSTLDHLSIADLVSARRRLGISRFVLLQRLNLMRTYGNDRFIERACFSDVAVGIGAWTHEGDAVLKGYPVFAQFTGGEQPSFLHAMRRSRGLPVSSLVAEKSFILNGGTASSVALALPFGTERSPERTTRPVQFSVEATRRTGSIFFFLVRAQP
jgi:hypothetical protein